MKRHLNGILAVLATFGVPVSVNATDQPSGRPDRAQFIREVLDAKPTEITPKFDDYTKDSYHIEGMDLLKGIEEATAQSSTSRSPRPHRAKLRAVVIVGPTGPLWSYTVLVFLEENRDAIRVNIVEMPHARITYKGTTTATENSFEIFIRKLTASQALAKGDPLAVKTEKGKTSEVTYDILVGVWTPLGRLLYYGDLQKPEASELQGSLLDISFYSIGAEQTYPKRENVNTPTTKN